MEKHFWWGLFYLGILLAAGLWIGAAMEKLHVPAAEDLDRAAQAALVGQMDAASDYVNQAEVKWQEGWSFTAAVADHAHMEEIDSLFAQLDVWGAECRPEEYIGCCARLSSLIRAMAEAHSLSWQNVL